jgi:hypothetical protein
MPTRFLMITAVVPMLVGAAQDAAWQPFTSREGGFTVQVPGKPKEEQQAIRTAGGTIDVTVYVLERKTGGTFAVGFAEFPEQAAKPGTTSRRLDAGRDGAVTRAGGKLTAERRIALDRYPGRELHIEVDGKTFVRTRLYAVKNRLYQLVAIGTKESVSSEDAERFLDSLDLAEKKD